METILVVEDEPTITTILEELLEDGGYRPVSSKGPDAATVAAQTHPALVLLDLLLERTHGSDVVAQLRADPETKAIPILITSALPDAGKIAQDVGADAVLFKPFELRTLMFTIGELIHRQRPLIEGNPS